jgi:tRNA threonylcarbamoyl adenosine modification protein YeaZ
MPAPAADALLLSLDAGSPLVSVAVGRAGTVVAERSIGIERSSEALLRLIDEALAESGARPRDLGGVIALRGPGSFTGLRVGLATALGLCDALGIPGAAAPTLLALAASAPPDAPVVAAAVNAMRGEWFLERYAAGEPPCSLAPPRIVAAADLDRVEADCVIGFGLPAAPGDGYPPRIAAPPLAPAALRLAWRGALSWESQDLVHPLYLREPATTPAKV